MTQALASQGGLIAVGAVIPGAEISQAGLMVLAAVQPDNLISQAGLIVIGQETGCSTRRCQLWTIERTDGVTLRFTSHDNDVTWGGETYGACASLNESASEQSSEQNSVGNIELSGIIDSEHISDDDLYAGLYDDAFVEVWRVTWDDEPTDRVTRIAAGWLGTVSQGEQGFKGEVLGPGARLLQKPLLDVVTSTCRWDFGSTECGVSAEALAIVGTVLSAPSRAYLYADILDPGGLAQWERGKLRFTYGRNAGQVCAVREVDFATGLIILWARSGFTPDPGDTFDLLPGCDKGFDGGCTAYANKVRFGGFPHVPGQDAIAQAPLAKA